MLNMLWPGRSKVLFLAGPRDVFLLQMSGQFVGLTEPPVNCVLWVLFLGVEWLGCK
jgi:hypothetical protein